MALGGQNGCSDTVTQTVSVNEHPIAKIMVNDSLFCEDSAVVILQAQSSIVNGNIANNWNFGDGMSSVLDSVNHTYLDTGKMEVVMVSISDSSCTDTARKTITIVPIPDNSFVTAAINSSTYTFTPTVTTYANYEWKFGDGNTSTQTAPTHAYVQRGSQIVELSVADKYSCVSIGTGEVQIEEVSGVELNQIEGMSIFPNPNKGAFNIHFTNEGYVKLKLINNLGQKVWNNEAQIENNENVEINNLSKGVYILYIEMNTVVNSHKIIVN